MRHHKIAKNNCNSRIQNSNVCRGCVARRNFGCVKPIFKSARDNSKGTCPCSLAPCRPKNTVLMLWSCLWLWLWLLLLLLLLLLLSLDLQCFFLNFIVAKILLRSNKNTVKIDVFAPRKSKTTVCTMLFASGNHSNYCLFCTAPSKSRFQHAARSDFSTQKSQNMLKACT